MARKRPAPYVALSVYYADDEAVMEAGEDAELMYVRMLAYAGRTPMTEGYVPRRVCLTRLGIAERPELGPETSPESRLERLTESGLIVRERDGYRLVSWLKWNRSIEEMGREREQDRKRKAVVTRDDPEQAPETGPETLPEMGPESGPVPEGRSRSRREDKDMVARRDRFDEFWSIYPKRSPHANPKKPAQDKWDQLVKTTDPDVIIAGARRLAAARAGQEPQHTPQARTWLNERRWQDDDGAEQPPEQRGSFTAPPLPEGAPRAMFVPWNRAHRDAWLAGKPGPTDWREIQVAS